MGIPSYFSHLVRKYPWVVQPLKTLQPDNFYLDANSIVYDAYHHLCSSFEGQNVPFDDVERHIIGGVVEKIKEYLSTIRPRKKVIVAFDGVAPRAKMEQQRTRRYKAWYQKQLLLSSEEKERKEGKDSAFVLWNTAAITPGTRFMAQLNQRVKHCFAHDPRVIVSGSDEAGEGEHKLFAHIRDTRDTHAEETTMVYGLDADLIMLAMNHLQECPRLYLFRDTAYMGHSVGQPLDPRQHYFLDIPAFATALCQQMGFESRHHDGVSDYIFMCFLLGNDFLPHFPALSVRHNGIRDLMRAYNTALTPGETLTRNRSIVWPHVHKFIAALANQETNMVQTISRIRHADEQRERAKAEDKENAFQRLPLFHRDLEHRINPFKPHWQARYYAALFPSSARPSSIAQHYLQGLEWTFRYYCSPCPDWRWHYPFAYPPLLQDLALAISPNQTPCFCLTASSNPVSELVQLSYVLPRASLMLLPHPLCARLLAEHSDWYSSPHQFLWAYCTFFWEAHPMFSDVDFDTLERFVLTVVAQTNKK